MARTKGKDDDGEKKRKAPARWRELEFSESELRYDPEEFYVPSHDAHGHSVSRGCRMMPILSSEVDLIFQNFGKWCGWETAGDFIRYAINYQIQRLHAMEPTMPRTYLGALMISQEVLGDDKRLSQTELYFESTWRRIQEHVQNGDRGEVVRLLASVQRVFKRCEDRGWKRRWEERFNSVFGHWLQPGSVTVEAPLQLAPAPQAPAKIEPEDDIEYEDEG